MKHLIKVIKTGFLFCILNILFINTIWSQNCNIECTELLKNNTCSINQLEGWPLPNSSLPMNAFYWKLVPDWRSSHGTPSILQDNGNGTFTIQFTTPNGTEKNFLALADGYNPNTEGIFQNVSLINDPHIKYNIYLKCKNIWVSDLDPDGLPNHLMSVFLASNLINYSNPPHSPQNVPNKRLGSLHMNVFNTSLETNIPFNLEVNENYNQIWIYTEHYMNQLVKEEGTTIETVNLSCNTTALTDIIATSEDKSFTFNALNASDFDFVEYCWDFGDGTTSYDINPTHTYANYGTYTVCLKVKDENGCCGEFCKEIIVMQPPHSCQDKSSCISIGTPGGTVYLSSLLSGPNPVIPSSPGSFPFTNTRVVKDLCFSVEGRLIADVGIIFFNDHWYMGPGASIEQNAWLLIASQSVFQGCEKMWKGFVVPEDQIYKTIVFMNNCTIRDAAIGVEIENNNGISSSNSHFINNIYGVDLGGINAVTNTVINDFSGNEFAFNGNMLPQYPGQSLQWYDRSQIGIRPYNIALLNVNENNVFRNLVYGINSYKTGMEIHGSEFRITDISGNNGNYSNYAIKMDQSNSVVTIEDNDFYDNGHGIQCENGSNNKLDILNNRFNVNNNFEIYYSLRINISNNKNGTIAISDKNEFNINSYIPCNVINLSDCNYSSLNIIDNNFDIDYAIEGGVISEFIRLTSCSGYSLVSDNTINMDRANRIAQYSNHGMKFINNTFSSNVTGPGGYGTLFLLSNSNNGFYKKNIANNLTNLFSTSLGSNNTFCCNSSNIPGRTFGFFNGGLKYSSLYANNIVGLELKHGPIIGTQPSRGNIWNTSLSWALINEFEFVPTSEYVSMNQFKVDPNQIGFKPFSVTPQIWAEDWFKNTGISKTCEEYTACDTIAESEGGNSGNGGGGDIAKEKVFEVVDNFVGTCKYNSTGHNSYPELSDWDNAMYMYDFQYRYPQINWMGKIDSVSLVVGATGCKEKITDDVVGWYILKKEKDNIFTPTQTENEIVFNIHQNIASNGESILNWHDQNPDSLIGTQVYPFHRTIALLMDSIESINNDMKLRSLQNAQDVTDEIDRLSSRYQFLNETKKVWTLEMKRVISGLGSITPQEWADMQRIAGLCPMEYGSVVYDAWSFLDVAGMEPPELDFERNCAQNLIPRSADVRFSGKIYPNPTAGVVNINYKRDEIDAVRVYNSMGQEVFSVLLSGNENISSIDISSLKNGMYIIRFENAQKIISSSKLILMK